jgi:hypothetical protein
LRGVWLDYDHPKRTVMLGAGDYRVDGHVFYVRGEDREHDVKLHVVESRRPVDLAT